MIRMIVIGLVLALTACSGGDVRSTRITPDLLENEAKLQRISNRLPPEDRKLFGRYVLSRTAISGSSPLVNAQGKDPATVEDVITLMRGFEARDKAAEALNAERQAKWDEMEKQSELLEAKAAAAGWAPKENADLRAHNQKMMEMQEDYKRRFEAISSK